MLMSKENLRKAEKTQPGTLRRLAKFIGLKDVDQMSDRHVLNLLTWYFKRRYKRVEPSDHGGGSGAYKTIL